MAKVLTDKTLIDQFLNRGTDKIFPSKELLEKKLLSGERIRAYQGFDPTGPHLHVGHAMGIRALRILQKLGHEVIFLVGDYTAKVGDPDPNKDSARKLLTDDEIAKNMQGWKEQASQLIEFDGENPVQFKHNYEWLSKLQLNDLIGLMSKSTVQQMIERDMFQRRLAENNPIGMQEFLYPLLQGYDSVAMDVDLEIGGTDQIFNMMVGRQLVANYLNKEKFVRANVMMDAPDGRTMSKTKGNGINLADTANDMFGKAMSYRDELIIKALELITEMPDKEISHIKTALDKGENPMQYKKIMAFEIVKMIKGAQAAEDARIHFEKAVQNKEVTEDMIEEISFAGKTSLALFLRKVDLSDTSTSSIRRLIEQGGVEVNGSKFTEPNIEIDFKSGDIIKYGKRKFFKIK